MKYRIQFTIENGTVDEVDEEFEGEMTDEDAQLCVDQWVRRNVVGVVTGFKKED